MDSERSALDAIDIQAVRTALGGISEKTLQRLIDDGRFPKPFNVTVQGRLWFRRDVEWFIWGQAVKSRLTKKQRSTTDKPRTTADKSAPKA